MQASITARVGGGLLILGDVEIALDAAFPGQAGVLALAGTGSNVVGRTTGRQLITAGGWGPALADQGSGHIIGIESLRAIFLATDEEKHTPVAVGFGLLETALSASPDGIREHSSRTRFLNLDRSRVNLRGAGDETALAVLRKQGEDLAYLVRLVIRRLRRASTEDGWTPPVAFAGSILENVPPVRDALIAAVQREFPGVQAPDKVVDPIDGALWRARTGKFC